MLNPIKWFPGSAPETRGRRRLDPNKAKVAAVLPADLIANVTDYAATEMGMRREDAIAELLVIGLFARARLYPWLAEMLPPFPDPDVWPAPIWPDPEEHPLALWPDGGNR